MVFSLLSISITDKIDEHISLLLKDKLVQDRAYLQTYLGLTEDTGTYGYISIIILNNLSNNRK